ncbi:MAG: hypothetical protein ACP5QO_17640 [Clostridia bacterium]
MDAEPLTLAVSQTVLIACITEPAPVLLVSAAELPAVIVGRVLCVSGPVPDHACRLVVTALAGRDPLAVSLMLLTTCRVCGGPIAPYDALCDQRCFSCWLAALEAEPPRPAAPLSLPIRTYILHRRSRPRPVRAMNLP